MRAFGLKKTPLFWSLLGHAVLLLALFFLQGSIQSPEPLGIELVSAPRGGSGEAKKLPRAKEIAPSPLKDPQALPSKVEPGDSQQAKAGVNSTGTNAGAETGILGTDRGEQATERTRYLYELRLFLEQRKRYPTSAKNLGEEGTVKVAFTITRDGEIKNIRLHTSSSFASLDQATLALVNTRFKAFPEKIPESSLDIIVPIGYRLTDVR